MYTLQFKFCRPRKTTEPPPTLPTFHPSSAVLPGLWPSSTLQAGARIDTSDTIDKVNKLQITAQGPSSVRPPACPAWRLHGGAAWGQEPLSTSVPTFDLRPRQPAFSLTCPRLLFLSPGMVCCSCKASAAALASCRATLRLAVPRWCTSWIR